MAIKKVTHYFDYKSPYAYLAQEETYRLQEDFDVQVDWLPYTLDIPSFLGAAEVDQTGRVISEARNAHQWRRVKYSYMDCRREANRRHAGPVRPDHGERVPQHRLDVLGAHTVADDVHLPLLFLEQPQHRVHRFDAPGRGDLLHVLAEKRLVRA